MTDDVIATIGVICFIFLFVGAIFEVGLLVYSFVNADKVECNLLWCKFTDEREVRKNCFENGVKVNCSKMEDIDVDEIIEEAMKNG